MANGTQLASDKFVRGSYPTNLGGGDGWTAITGQGALTITSAGVVQVSAINTSCGVLWTGLTWANDQYSEITLGTVPPATADTSAYVRMDAAQQNGYRLDIHLTIATLYVFNGGTPTQLINVTGLTFTAGDTLRLTVIGTTLIVTHNDTTIGFISDATVASGSTGCFMYNQLSTATSSIASWSGGKPSGNTNGIWTKQGLVIPALAADYAGGGIPGASNPTMLYEGNAQILSGSVFKMWFQGGGNGIFYAESTDGFTWTRKATAVLAARGIPKIFKNGATYYLHVTHAPNVWTQIDQYTSSDGITWTLAHANILSVGAGGTWDSAFCGYFQVMAIVSGTWYALYQGSNGTQAASGLATSPDGVTWTKYGSNPVIATWDGGIDRVFQSGGVYYAWFTDGYAGQSPGPQTCIMRFHTTDFIAWTPDAVSLQPDNVDEGRNYSLGQIAISCLLEVKGTTYHFYCSSPSDSGGGSFQIRLATAPYTLAQIVQNQEYFVQYTQVATDTFQRADGSLGANWTTAPSASSLQIASNKAEPSVANVNCNEYYSGASFHNDQYSDITIATLAASNAFLSPGARESTTLASHYGPSFHGADSTVQTVGLFKAVNGVATQLGSNTNFFPKIGDVIRISCVGTDISVFWNQRLILQSTDTDLTSGFPGMSAFNTLSIANAQISAWAGGNADAPLPIPITPSSGGDSQRFDFEFQF